MDDPYIPEEFVGRFGISYKDGEVIYAYDEITHGLYKFSLSLKEVTIVLSPINISHRNTVDRIMGISKNRNEIILIPLNINSEWIFYNTKEEKIRYESPIKSRIRISSVITIGSNIFLIPGDIYNPIIIFSIDNMKIVTKYENWYKKNIDRVGNENSIWGASSYDDFVVFPIVYSNDIVYIDCKNIRIITVDIPFSIHSVSIYKNKIWVLPMSGQYIYAVNFKGEITDKVDILKIEAEISTSDFIRIVSTEENIFLLPTDGKKICVYQYKKNEFVQIETEEKYSWGKLFIQGDAIPYWEFTIENKTLHLLPSDCRYKIINLDSLENKSYKLLYGKNFNNNEYRNMILSTQRKNIFREQKDYLEIFLQFILSSGRNYFMEEDVKSGRTIWKNCSN